METRLEDLQHFVLEKVKNDTELYDRLKTDVYWYSFSLNEIEERFDIHSIYDAYKLFSKLVTVHYEKESNTKKLINYPLVTELVADQSMERLVITFHKIIVEDILLEKLGIPKFPESTSSLFGKDLYPISGSDIKKDTPDWMIKGMDMGNADFHMDMGFETTDIFMENGHLKIRYSDGETLDLPLNTEFPNLDSRAYDELLSLRNLRNPLARYLVISYYSLQVNETRELPIDELKERLGLREKYEKYSHLKDKVIKPAMKELAENTDVQLCIEEVKTTNRKVVSLLLKKTK